MSHRNSLIKKNRELSKPLDIFNVGFVGGVGSGGAVDETRGVFGGGYSSYVNGPNYSGYAVMDVIDYITVATLGNATNFGVLSFGTHGRSNLAGVSSDTRGVFGGGQYPNSLVMDYITIATTGNTTAFGDLSVARYNLAGVSSSTRGVFGGGYAEGQYGGGSNVMDYITIATTGNATDFGDLTTAHRSNLAGVSA